MKLLKINTLEDYLKAADAHDNPKTIKIVETGEGHPSINEYYKTRNEFIDWRIKQREEKKDLDFLDKVKDRNGETESEGKV